MVRSIPQICCRSYCSQQVQEFHSHESCMSRYDIELWGPMAERIAEQVPKGSRVCVQGKLNPSSWTNREGIKQTKLRVLTLSFELPYYSLQKQHVHFQGSQLQNVVITSGLQLQITANEVRFVERDGGVPAVSAGQAGWGAQQPQQQQVMH